MAHLAMEMGVVSKLVADQEELFIAGDMSSEKHGA